MSLGERIRKRRDVLEITQRQLAEALGLTPQHVSAIEQDKRAPSLSSLAKMAEELAVTADYLVTGKESVVTGLIPAIKADEKLEPGVKKALITLVKKLHIEAEKT